MTDTHAAGLRRLRQRRAKPPLVLESRRWVTVIDAHDLAELVTDVINFGGFVLFTRGPAPIGMHQVAVQAPDDPTATAGIAALIDRITGGVGLL
jgi:hypothetical protein